MGLDSYLDGWLCKGNSTQFPVSGLFCPDDFLKDVPLVSREVAATVYCETGLAEVQETLCYIAQSDCAVAFNFPLPARAAVFRFSAAAGDNLIVSQTQTKAGADVEYFTTSQDGKPAGGKCRRTSCFYVTLGTLHAQQACTITLSYVQLLDRISNCIEFSHTSSRPLTEGRRSKSSLDRGFTSVEPYGLSYSLILVSATDIADVHSPFPISIQRSGREALVRWEQQVADPCFNFSVVVELPQQPVKSGIVLQTCERGSKPKSVLLATFSPRLSGPIVPELRELWFVIDCSGSMNGVPIQQARDSALFFVKDLPSNEGLKFNLIVFGSTWCSLYSECRGYCEINEAEALCWVQEHVRANMGGTEILSTLTPIYKLPVTKGYRRCIIFLTDGSVSAREEQQIISLVTAKTPTARATSIYCLGLGNKVHHSLLDSMSSRTGGISQYALDEESISAKLLLLKKAATADATFRQPRLIARGVTLKLSPWVLPPRLFSDEPLHVFAELCNESIPPDASLCLSCLQPDGSPLNIDLPINPEQAHRGDALAVLHAMCSITALQKGVSQLHVNQEGAPRETAPSEYLVRKTILKLALEENLVTPFTQVVGVLLSPDPKDAMRMASTGVVQLQVPSTPAGAAPLFPRNASFPDNVFTQRSAPGCYPSADRTSRSPPYPRTPPTTDSSSPAVPARIPDALLTTYPPSNPSSPMARVPGALLKHTVFAQNFHKSRKDPNQSCTAFTLPAPSNTRERNSLLRVMPEAEPFLNGPQAAQNASFACVGMLPERTSYQGRLSPSGRLEVMLEEETEADFVEQDTVAEERSVNCSMGQARPPIGDREDSSYMAMKMGLSTPYMVAKTAIKEFRSEGNAIPPTSMPRSMSLGEADGGDHDMWVKDLCTRSDTAHNLTTDNCPEMEAVLRCINLGRTTDGFWAVGTPGLLDTLCSGRGEQGPREHDLIGAKLGGCAPDDWMTVLVLAYLRKHCMPQQPQWEAMEGKALRWLSARWPHAQVGCSPGAAIINAMKLM